MVTQEELIDLIYRLLPVVEDAKLDPCYKPGAMAELEKRVRDTLKKAEER